MARIAALVALNGAAVDASTVSAMARAMARTRTDPIVASGAAAAAAFAAVSCEECALATTSTEIIAADLRLDLNSEMDGEVSAATSGINRVVSVFKAFGTAGFERISGDFAIAVYDRERSRLVLARDALGVKPLYYARLGDLVFVASEARAILASGRVSREPDENRIASSFYPSLEGLDQESSWYRAIKRVPAGTVIEFESWKTVKTRYWSPSAARDVRYSRGEEYATAFRAILFESVTQRISGVKRPALLLSGGVDSGSVACFAAQLHREHPESVAPLSLFSATAEDPARCPELPFIQAVVEATGFRSTLLRPSQTEPMQGLFGCALADADDPFDPITRLVPRLLYSVVAENGMEVVLDGVDGDIPLWPGVFTLAHQFRQGNIGALLGNLGGITRYTSTTFRRVIGRYVLLPNTPRVLRRTLRRMRGELERYYVPMASREFVARAGLLERIESSIDESGSLASNLREEHERGFGLSDLVGAMEAYDRMAAVSLVEARHPFIDRRLVEFGIGLPIEQKVSRGLPKTVLRSAGAGVLPDVVRLRPSKSDLGNDFFLPLVRFFENEVRRLPAYEESLGPYFDIDLVRQLMQRYNSGRRVEDLVELLPIVSFGAWLQGNG